MNNALASGVQRPDVAGPLKHVARIAEHVTVRPEHVLGIAQHVADSMEHSADVPQRSAVPAEHVRDSVNMSQGFQNMLRGS